MEIFKTVTSKLVLETELLFLSLILVANSVGLETIVSPELRSRVMLAVTAIRTSSQQLQETV